MNSDEFGKYLDKKYGDMDSDTFRMRCIGKFGASEEVEDSSNRPGQELWKMFSVVCQKIDQPHTRCKAEATVGSWYLSLCYDKNWYIFEKTEEGSRRPFAMPGLRSNGMIETLTYVDAFLFQYNNNMQ